MRSVLRGRTDDHGFASIPGFPAGFGKSGAAPAGLISPLRPGPPAEGAPDFFLAAKPLFKGWMARIKRGFRQSWTSAQATRRLRPSAGRMPSPVASFARRKENSPIWARARATVMAVRAG